MFDMFIFCTVPKKMLKHFQFNKVVKHNNFIFGLVILSLSASVERKNVVNIRNYIIIYKIFPLQRSPMSSSPML